MKMYTTSPVLFIIFNRLATTQHVFARIKDVKPRQLFIAADGPRFNNEGDAEKCKAVRNWVIAQIDWECEVKTLFRKENVGCGRGPSEAISWFFEHVEQGIILEDDCCPEQDFFIFCDELLDRYKNNEEVMLISGTNLLKKYRSNNSYIFSEYAGIWGWASWKRAWSKFDYQIMSWQEPNNRKKVNDYFLDPFIRKVFNSKFQETFEGNEVSWWDYQWYYTRIINNGIGIIPAKNLISNIGFGNDATHTFDPRSSESQIPTFSLAWPLNHPKKIAVDFKYDKKVEQIVKASYRKPSYVERIRNRILELFQ